MDKLITTPGGAQRAEGKLCYWEARLMHGLYSEQTGLVLLS